MYCILDMPILDRALQRATKGLKENGGSAKLGP